MPVKNKSFLLFLSGHCVSNFGDAFQFIAFTILLVKLTGSGLSAAFGIICSQVPGLFLSPFAGYLGDRFNEKNLCIAVDLLRGFVVIMFVGNHSTIQVYTLSIILSILDIAYGPARKKILVNILEEKELLMGNSLLMGGSGVAYLIGPFLASILIGIWGADTAFFINSISFLFSALSVVWVRTRKHSRAVLYKGRLAMGNMIADIRDGFKYFNRDRQVKDFIIFSTVISTAAVSVNLAFYPFSFDTLKVTDRGWGLMMSIFYGTNLLAMFISIFLNKKIAKGMIPFIYISLFIVGIIWFNYGIVKDLYTVLVLQAVEGTVLAFAGILIGTKLQIIINKAFMARVMSIGDIIGSIFKIAGVGTTYLLMTFFSEKFIFLLNSIFLLSYTFYKMIRHSFWSLKKYKKNPLF